jgi:VWFA-related protein
MRTAALSLFLAAAPLLAQDAKPTPAETPHASDISVNANLVVLATVVRDRKGALVNGLTKDDFVLKVKDAPQAIRYFDHDTDVPLTLGLLVDVSRSQRDVLDDEKNASQSFLSTILTPASATRAADTAFVVQFAKEIEMLQDVTPNHDKLQSALKLLGTSSPQFHTDPPPDTTDKEGRHIRGGGTALYDALLLSGNDVLSKQSGRKALIVLTDGVDNGSKESLAEAIEADQRADTVVYAIYFKGDEHPGPNNNNNRRGGGYPGGGGNNRGGGNSPNGNGGPSRKPSIDGKQVLERLCGETGGRVFEVSRKQPIDDIYKQIAEELRSEYRLGFTPQDKAASYGFHQIDLTLKDPEKNKKLNIQVRSGYFAGDSK